ARQVEVEVVEDLDLLPRLAVSAEGDEIVRTSLGALVADDAGLGAGGRLGLQAEHAAEARRRRPALRRVLKGEGGLRRVLERQPHPFHQIDEEERFEEAQNHNRQSGSNLTVESSASAPSGRP